jgi:hypothetical protein
LSEGASGYRLFNSLSDFVQLDVQKHPERSDMLVVRAAVTGVAPGRAYVQEGGDSTAQHEVSFDEGGHGADWWTLHVELQPKEILFGELPEKPLRAGLAFRTESYDEIAPSLELIHDAVWVLYPDSAVFENDPGVYGVADNGRLVATVAVDGSLALPAMDDAEQQLLLKATPTLDALKAVATLVTDESQPAK